MVGETEQPVVRERVGCVLGIAFGLLVLGSIVAFIFLPKGEARDGARLFADWFGPTELPAGYAIVDAGKLTGGEEVLQLSRPDAPPEREKAAPPKTEGKPERVDWARVELGLQDQFPRGITLVKYPTERAQSELNRLFSEKLQIGKLDEVGGQGGRMVLELGTIPWADKFAIFVLEREFEAGGTFRDIVRVNLSKDQDGLVANLAWSRSEPFAKDRLQAVLAGLRRP